MLDKSDYQSFYLSRAGYPFFFEGHKILLDRIFFMSIFMFKKEKIKILIAIGILIILFCVFFVISDTAPKEISPPLYSRDTSEIKTEQNKTNTVLEINEKKYESEVVGTVSVYEFMEKLKKEEKINFKDKTYSGMGKFIEEINGIKNDGGRNWIYYVNGKKADIGVSNYKIKAGDIVSWKYEKDIN